MDTIKRYLQSHKRVFVAILAVYVGIVVLQHLLQFAGYVFARNDFSAPLVFSAEKEATKLAEQKRDIESVKVTLQVQDNTYEETIRVKDELKIDERILAETLGSYDAKRVLIPLGGLLWPVENDSRAASVVSESLRSTVKQIAATRNLPPIDASIGVLEKELIIYTETQGWIVDDESLVTAVVNSWHGDEETVIAQAIVPSVTKSELEPLIQPISQSLRRPITFTDGKKTVQFTDDELILASAVQYDKEQKTWKLEAEALQSYFIPLLNDAFGQSDTPTIVERREGIEVSRIQGVPGRIVQLDEAAIASISAHYSSQSPDPEAVTITTIATQPAISFIDLSANTQQNLQSLLSQLADTYDASISVRQLYGGYWSADSGGSKQRIAASTYKLAVAYYAAAQVDSGSWQWSDAILNTTLEDCVRRMISLSDNDCPQELLYSRIGAQKMTSYATSLGMQQTCYGCSYTKSSTNDQIVILQAILEGKDISNDSRDRLLSYMRDDIYRNGVPSASDYDVASKAGFVLDVKNDSAIIFTANGPLLVSIYTQGESWAAVRDITQRILRQLEA